MIKNAWPLILALASTASYANSYCRVELTLGCPQPGDRVHYTMDCPEDPPTEGMHQFKCLAAPPPAQIFCQSANGIVECEAWPQSPHLTYRYVYTVLNGVEPNYSASEFSPTLLGNCTGDSGRVSVTVIAPNGESSSARTPFACLHNE